MKKYEKTAGEKRAKGEEIKYISNTKKTAGGVNLIHGVRQI